MDNRHMDIIYDALCNDDDPVFSSETVTEMYNYIKELEAKINLLQNIIHNNSLTKSCSGCWGENKICYGCIDFSGYKSMTS